MECPLEGEEITIFLLPWDRTAKNWAYFPGREENSQSLLSQQCFQMTSGVSGAFWLADSRVITMQCMKPWIVTDWHTPTEHKYLESQIR